MAVYSQDRAYVLLCTATKGSTSLLHIATTWPTSIDVYRPGSMVGTDFPCIKLRYPHKWQVMLALEWVITCSIKPFSALSFATFKERAETKLKVYVLEERWAMQRCITDSCAYTARGGLSLGSLNLAPPLT